MNLPSISLLDNNPITQERKKRSEELLNSAKLIKKLAEFQVSVKIVRVEQGPVLMTYYVKLEEGVRLLALLKLSEEIALALEAQSVRIVRVPGTETVAIEVARPDRQVIKLRSLLSDSSYYENDSFNIGMNLAIGVKSDGSPLVLDLAKAPHLLIAGTTGSGKSIAIHATILSLLFRFSDTELQLGLVDVKRVELGVYKNLPHCAVRDVATTPQSGKALLQTAVRAMQYRYELLAKEGCRDIETYQRRLLAPSSPMTKPWLPRLVIIIDELADLMLTSGKGCEEAIVRIGQLGRAAGVHLIVATQRPSVNVVTGLIKANISTRIAFKTSSGIDSGIILDNKRGAERLLGKGDGLLLESDSSLTRIHGAMVTESEIGKVVNYIVENQRERESVA